MGGGGHKFKEKMLFSKTTYLAFSYLDPVRFSLEGEVRRNLEDSGRGKKFEDAQVEVVVGICVAVGCGRILFTLNEQSLF